MGVTHLFGGKTHQKRKMLRRIRTNSKILIFNQFYQRNLRIGENKKLTALDRDPKVINWIMVARTDPINRMFCHVRDLNFVRTPTDQPVICFSGEVSMDRTVRRLNRMSFESLVKALQHKWQI